MAYRLVVQTISYNADYQFPETLSNPSPVQSKMTAALGPLPLGGTADGKAWCLKALHPADHTITKARFPGGSKHPTVSGYFTQVMEIRPDALVGGNHTTSWEAEMFLRQDPVAPASFRVITRADGDSTVHEFPWINRTLTTWSPFVDGIYGRCPILTLRSAYNAFAKGKNFYRITHLGATVEHICSSTTNQGTIISGQYAIEPHTGSIPGYPLTQQITGNDVCAVATTDSGHFPLQPIGTRQGVNTQVMFEAPLVRTWREGPYSQEMLLQGTNGYTGPAREGLYVPLKLSSPEKLVNVDHKYVLNGHERDSDLVQGVYREFELKQASDLNNHNCGWPYYATLEGNSGDPSEVLIGFKESGPSISHSVITGLDPHASLRVYLRVGYEYVPEITSDTACFAQMSPLPDELAVRMYQEVCARLKDAYPMDYNDKSTLLSVIDRVAKTLVPAIDQGLDFFAKIPGNPWAVPARGLRMLTQAYLKPAAAKSKGQSKPKSTPKQRKKKGGNVTSADVSAVLRRLSDPAIMKMLN